MAKKKKKAEQVKTEADKKPTKQKKERKWFKSGSYRRLLPPE